MSEPLPDPVNVLEYEARARAVLPKAVAEYIASGAADEVTVRENRRAFDDFTLHYRVLAGVGRRDLAVELLGSRAALPVLVAPMGFHGLCHADAEAATARAAAKVGAILVASTMSNITMEQIRSAGGGAPQWFQLYVYRDRGVTRSLVERAEAAGYAALMVTVDLPVLGKREADIRNRFALPPHLRVANLESAGLGTLAAPSGDSGVARYTLDMLDASLTWDDLDWLRSITRLPVLVKGVVRADDAAKALEHGAAGVVVSNHGGRQLDTAPATIRVLPEVVDAVAGRGLVLLDGGVRRGTDVVKALALGAAAVMVGRPVLWGLAVGGDAGAARVLELLRDEFDAALALCGCRAASAVPRDLVRW